jgi:hypothetical protein
MTTDVRRGEPVAEILQGAREAEADLIAMTTHGRSGLRRLLFGSVAEAVLRQAEIPVFLMRLANDQAAARAAWQGEKPRENVISRLSMLAFHLLRASARRRDEAWP